MSEGNGPVLAAATFSSNSSGVAAPMRTVVTSGSAMTNLTASAGREMPVSSSSSQHSAQHHGHALFSCQGQRFNAGLGDQGVVVEGEQVGVDVDMTQHVGRVRGTVTGNADGPAAALFHGFTQQAHDRGISEIVVDVALDFATTLVGSIGPPRMPVRLVHL